MQILNQPNAQMQPKTNMTEYAGRKVFVENTARLHMGFFDLHGGLGRKFGSIGLSLDAPVLHLSVSHQHNFVVSGAQNVQAEKLQRIEKAAHTFLKSVNLPLEANIWVDECIDLHAGLGSGTQISLAVGTALSQFYGLKLTTKEIAQLTNRGSRSGVGIATFDQGGLIIDGGRALNTTLPPILARYDFPKEWRILLIFDDQQIGVHGNEERIAFNELPQFSENLAAHLCRHVLMQAMPALVEKDLNAFGQSIQELQAHVGDYFAPTQGGRYASKRVEKALQHIASIGVSCFGQSSWGPTGFAVFENSEQAVNCLNELKTKFTELNWRICSARNDGAKVKVKVIG